MLKYFVYLNKKICFFLASRFPLVFQGGVSTVVLRDLLHTNIYAIIENNSFQSRRVDILEVGGADRPFLAKTNNYNLDGLDIDIKSNSRNNYNNFHNQSVEDPINKAYDLIFSVTLLEHVRDNHKSIKEMTNAMKAGGVQIHYIPNKYHPYAMILRAIGPRFQKKIIAQLKPEAVTVSGYPVFFHLCSVQKMEYEFRINGLDDVNVFKFYRANDYFSFFVPLYVLISFFENICRKLDIQYFCSGMICVAKRKLS